MRRIISMLTLAASVSLGGAIASAEEVAPVNLEGHVLGVVQYRGGFAKDLSVELAAPIALVGFKVSIPAFCRDVEVLEAGAQGEHDSVSVSRFPNEPNTFLIGRGTDFSAVVSSLTVTLNGPLSAGCDIPVLEFEGGPDVPPSPNPQQPKDGSFGSADGTRITIQGSRVARHNLAITPPGSHLPGRIVVSSPLIGNGPNSDTYITRGYADYPVRGQFGIAYCRVAVSLDFDYRNIIRNELIMRMTYPSHIYLDYFGLCVAESPYTGTWYLRQLSE